MPVQWDTHQGWQQMWEWSQPDPKRQALCVVDGRTREVEIHKSSGDQKIMKEYHMYNS